MKIVHDLCSIHHNSGITQPLKHHPSSEQATASHTKQTQNTFIRKTTSPDVTNVHNFILLPGSVLEAKIPTQPKTNSPLKLAPRIPGERLQWSKVPKGTACLCCCSILTLSRETRLVLVPSARGRMPCSLSQHDMLTEHSRRYHAGHAGHASAKLSTFHACPTLPWHSSRFRPTWLLLLPL